MGTDIHLMVEVKDEDGRWRNVVPPAGTRWAEYMERYGGGRRWDFYRDYDSFGVMANVRNGYGFAGVPTGGGFLPIASPRGLPKDADTSAWSAASMRSAGLVPTPEQLEDERDERNLCGWLGWLGDHSFSWLLVSEVLAHDWTKTVTHYGVVRPSTYAKWRDGGGGRPETWCGGVSGSAVRLVSNEEMDAIVATRDAGQERGAGLSYYTSISWTETYRESCSQLLELCEALPGMFGLPADRIRLVFGFDS